MFMKARYLAMFLSILVGGLNSYELKNPTPQTPFTEYHNRMIIFSPFYAGYERIKPESLYWGLLGYLTSTIHQHGNHHIFFQTEARIGHHYFNNGTDHLIPFAGIGYLNTFIQTKHHRTFIFDQPFRNLHAHARQSGVLFAEAGMLYDHEFNKTFNLGVNGKLIVGSAVGPGHERARYFGHGAVAGFDLGLPLTFRFGGGRHWDFRVEPFDVYLQGTKHRHNYFGFRSAFAYRF